MQRSFDETAIRNHCWMLHHLAERANVAGKLVLSAIADKALGLPPINQHFAIGDVDGMTAAAMAIPAPYGVYDSRGLMRPDLPEGAKGTQADVVATLAFTVDADADHEGVATPHAPLTPNYVIESSRGNYQEVLIPDRALLPDEAKLIARALKELSGDQMCVGDISRIMRVPGTFNYPSISKIKRGRSPEPQPVRVHKAWDSWTKVDDLRAVVAAHVKPKTVTKITAPVPDAVDGISHDGIRYAEVTWYCRHMAKVWTPDDRETTPDDFELAKRIKLSFPGQDGLDAVLLLGWEDREDELRSRWWSPNDFKTTGENLLTLRALKELNWMFRYAFGCPTPPPGPPVEIPAEVLAQMSAERERYLAAQNGPLPEHIDLTAQEADVLSRYWFHINSNRILSETSRSFCVVAGVDKHIGKVKKHMAAGGGMLASTWLAQNRFVNCVTWDPNEPLIVRDRIFEDEWMPAPGEVTFNLYLPPAIISKQGDVSRWLNHIKFIYPDEWHHVVMYFAHRVQRPGEKVNHGLVFISVPGTGKDITVEPVIAAIGARNFKSVSAKEFFGSDFNAYLESVLLRIDEVHDLGGESKYAFHDRLKTVMAAPPRHHYINAKHIPHHSCVNVCGTILTSNHVDALYIDPLDRRHFVCISERKQEDFPDGYFDDFGAWLDNGGNQAIAHYLQNLDISSFRPKATPPKTAGWHRIVAAGLAPESGDLADVIEALGKPAALTLFDIRMKTDSSSQLFAMLNDPKTARNLPRRLGECGYVKALNPGAKDGRWRLSNMNSKRADIYARQEMSESERVGAAKARASWIPSPRGAVV